MICKKCGSDHTQRLEVVYYGGTEETSGSCGHHDMKSELKTRLEKRAAPPAKWPIFGFIIIVIITCEVTASTISTKSGWLLFLVPLTLILIYKVIICIKYNMFEHSKDYKRWLESWYCHNCGHTYQQK